MPPGRARIVSSVPDGTTRRVIGLRVDQDATTVTVGVRCVAVRTAPKDGTTTQLAWRVVQRDVTLQPGQQVADLGLECGAQEKGVVAGWRLDYGLLPVGDEPQIKTRKFAIDNPTDRVLGGTLYLLCLGDRLTDGGAASDLVNTAAATTSTPQDGAAVLSASAGLRVQQAPADPPAAPSITVGDGPTTPGPAATPSGTTVVPRAAATRTATLRGTRVALAIGCATGCSGTVEVRADREVRVGGRTLRAKALLARTRFRVTGARGTVRVRLPAKVAAALRRQRVRRVRVVVRDAAGRRTTTVVTLRRR